MNTRAKLADRSELTQRVVSAVVLVLIVLLFSYLGGAPFALMCALLSLVLYYEWHEMVSVTPFDAPEALITLCFVGLLAGSLFGFVWIALGVFLVVGLVLEIVHDGVEEREIRWLGLGALYCAIPVLTLPIIREFAGFAPLMFVFLVVWVTDVGAYFAGRHFGGPKLMAAISPNKTWSGAVGGALAAVVLAVIWTAMSLETPLWGLAIAALLLSIASQIGDLFESGVKRVFGVKDSSQLIPGHGGFLDRVDGLLTASVVAAVFIGLGIS